jgi:hypothetical protein
MTKFSKESQWSVRMSAFWKSPNSGVGVKHDDAVIAITVRDEQFVCLGKTRKVRNVLLPYNRQSFRHGVQLNGRSFCLLRVPTPPQQRTQCRSERT